MTKIYLSDPEMRNARDQIAELFKSRLNEESRQVQKDMDDVRSEMFTETVLEILSGERSGGKWPQVVLHVYKNLSENIEFNELDFVEQGSWRR